MHALRGMKIKAKKDEVLVSLRTNRENHAQVVKEAREGFIKEAQRALEAKLGQIREGKIVSLAIGLKPPQDHTKAYDTIIKMLELSTEELIELDADQVRHFVNDDWEWKEQFLATNSAYSVSAANEYNDY